MDPRFRNPDFPDFVDRRQGDRRQPVYDTSSSIIHEHISRSWLSILGIMVMAFLFWVSLLANTSVDARLTCKKKCHLSKHIVPIVFVLE